MICRGSSNQACVPGFMFSVLRRCSYARVLALRTQVTVPCFMFRHSQVANTGTRTPRSNWLKGSRVLRKVKILRFSTVWIFDSRPLGPCNVGSRI